MSEGSLRQKLQRASDRQLLEIANRAGIEAIEGLRYLWAEVGRDAQQAPKGDWRVWLVLAGRGFGKTRAGAEWVRSIAERDGRARIAVVGATLEEARRVMVEGESGILAVCPPQSRPVYSPSLRRLAWKSGAQAILYGASEPESFRGPQHSHAWADEIGKWPFGVAAWELSHAGGSGALTLSGALPGHRGFAGTVPPDTEFYYSIASIARPAEWETGIGVINAGKIVRQQVIASSQGNGAVPFSSGLKSVALIAGAAWFAATQERFDALEARSIKGAGLAQGGGPLSHDQEILVPKATFLDLITASDDNKAVTPKSLRGNVRMAQSELPFVFGKLFGAFGGTVTQMKLLCFGDSIATYPLVYPLPYLNAALAASPPAGFPTNFTGSFGILAGGSMGVTALSGTVTVVGNQWDQWVTGDVGQLSNGGSFKLNYAGADPTFSKITLFYIKQPGAGTMTVKVGGTTVGTLNAANATIELGIWEYTQTAAQAQVTIDVSVAAVRFVEFHKLDQRTNGIDLYNISKGGIALNDMMSVSTGRDNLETYLAHVLPDLFTFEMKENSSYLATELVKLGDIIDAAMPNGDKLFCGSTPMSNPTQDADQVIQNGQIEAFATTRSYAYFDKYKPFVRNNDPTTAWPYLNSLGWGGDGTHVGTACSAYTGKLMVRDLGLAEYGYAYAGQAVSQRQTPSAFARGTKFGRLAGAELTLNTDAAFGFDWTIAASRMITIQSDAGTVNTQFSFNTGVFPNVRPIATDFNSAGNVRKMDTNSGTGIEFTRLRKTDNPGGGGMHLQTGLLRNGFTRAELLAINAANNKGALAYCTDATPGAQWVWARGTTGTPATDWVTVDGNAAI